MSRKKDKPIERCKALQEMFSEKIEEEKARFKTEKARFKMEKARADALKKENERLRAKLLASGINPDYIRHTD